MAKTVAKRAPEKSDIMAVMKRLKITDSKMTSAALVAKELKYTLVTNKMKQKFRGRIFAALNALKKE